MQGCSTLMRSRFRFGGDIDPADFADFALERVRRLDLGGRAAVDGREVVCEVEGQPDLVDAFEMACLIGPAGSLVTDYDRVELPGDAP